MKKIVFILLCTILLTISCKDKPVGNDEDPGFSLNGTSWMADNIDFSELPVQVSGPSDLMTIDFNSDIMSMTWSGSNSGTATAEIVEIVDSDTIIGYFTQHSAGTEFEKKYCRAVVAVSGKRLEFEVYEQKSSIDEAKASTTVVFERAVLLRADFDPLTELNGTYWLNPEMDVDMEVIEDNTMLLSFETDTYYARWVEFESLVVGVSDTEDGERLSPTEFLGYITDHSAGDEMEDTYMKTRVEFDDENLTIWSYTNSENKTEAAAEDNIMWGPFTFDAYSLPTLPSFGNVWLQDDDSEPSEILVFEGPLFTSDVGGVYSTGYFVEGQSGEFITYNVFHSMVDDGYAGKYYRMTWDYTDGGYRFEASAPCGTLTEARTALVGEGNGGWTSSFLTE